MFTVRRTVGSSGKNPRSPGRSGARISFVMLLSALWLAGCQHVGGERPALTLEEAKQVTASFGGASFTPPPRAVADVTAILSKQARDDLEWVAEAQNKVDAEPPAGADSGDLAKFYYGRGLAASKLGRTGQEIVDYRLAMEYGEKARNWEVVDMGGWLLGLADMFAGSFSQAVVDWEQAVKVSVRIGLEEDLVISYAVLADLYAKAGDPAGVKRSAELSRKARARAEGDDFQYWDPRERSFSLHEWAASKAMREASLHEVSGNFVEAEPFHRQAIESFIESAKYMDADLGDESFDPVIFNWLHANLAENLRRQGRLVEAEVWARRNLTTALKMNGRYSAHTAFMLGRLTRVIFDQGRFADAEALARANLETYRKSGASADSVFFAQARVVLADTLVAQNRWPEALAGYEQARHALATDDYARRKFVDGNLNWGHALLELGRTGEATSVFDDAEARLNPMFGPGHYALAEVAGFKAKALVSTGNRAEALNVFAAAVPTLLRAGWRDAGEGAPAWTRSHRLRTILESYIALLADVRGTALETATGLNSADEAFRLADAVRLQSVHRAVSASGARAAARDPELADLVRREQDSKHQIASLLEGLADMLSRATTERSESAVASLREKIETLQAANRSLRGEIEARFPKYADLINPQPVTADQVRGSMAPGEALIATFVTADRTYIWAIPHTGETRFAGAAVGAEDLADTVALLRASLEPNARTLGDIPDFDVAAAHDLYRLLLEPVKDGWQDANSLLVVADGALGYLPLSVLPTAATDLPPQGGALFANHRSVPWLVRTHAVTMLPAVASLRTLRGLPPAPAGRKAYVGFGDPYFSAAQASARPTETMTVAGRAVETRGLPVRLRAAPRTSDLDSAELARLPRLPDTADEIKSTALALGADPTRDVFLGSRASEEAVKGVDLSGYKVLAFATHGLVPGDLDGLREPALALSAPSVVGGSEDGLLTMGEIMGLKLDADWVVLSACNTGTGSGAGAEAVSGLGRAFFYAGTRALLVSNWPVESTSAKTLITDLFKRQAANDNLARAEALRQAMIGLMDGPGFVDQKTGQTVYSYAHPIFWAPFSLVGDGGGVLPGA